MTESTYQDILVATLVVTTVIQGLIHGVTWWALGPQPDGDEFAKRLREREGALAVKSWARVTFELLLLFLVIKDYLPLSTGLRFLVYTITMVAVIYAVVAALLFAHALRQENGNWGRPARQETVSRVDQNDL